MAIGVPTAFRQALLVLEGLDEADAQRLLETVAAADRFQPVGTLRELVEQVLPEGQTAQAERLVPALLSLRGQLRGTPPERLAEALSGSADLDLGSDARKRLRDRVAALLGSAAITSTASAVELLTQHERNYQTARVFTDIRPIFERDVTDPPTGAVIVEMLQIQTWDREGQSETLYVALDESDLREIKEVVERALEKTDTLRSFLAEQSIAYFELDKREL